MKRILLLLLTLCLLLCACGTPAEPTETTTAPTTAATTAPTTEATTAPTTEATIESTTEPTEPPVLYRNPLNGEALEAPYTGRIFASTINNIEEALPHRGISQADLFFEMFCNGYVTRGLAMFSNVTEVDSIGSIRSNRYNFTDLCQAYNAVLIHASASKAVLQDMKESGIANMFADEPIGYRDNDRYKKQGYLWEHCLFANGQSLWNAAEKQNIKLSLTDKDYGMHFEEDATPANGQSASEVEIAFTLYNYVKTSTMKYDAQLDKYIYNQYGKEMVDESTDAPEAFRNVIVILAPTHNEKGYHIADLSGSGEGYFACGGKMVPILWSHAEETEPFIFTLTDGTPLIQGVGSTYIAIAPTGSPVTAK